MKQLLVLAIATFGLTASAVAQVPEAGTSPGPHDPNPPPATPDLRLPPPCAPTPNLAAAPRPATPIPAHRAMVSGDRVTAADSDDPTLCSANTVTLSAELPLSSATAAQ